MACSVARCVAIIGITRLREAALTSSCAMKSSGIAHREVEGVAHQLHGTTQYFFASVRGHIFRQLHRNGDRREIDELHTELYFQRLDELLLGNDAALHQHVAQTLLTFLLQFQRRSSCSCEITPEDSSRSPKRIYAIGIHLRINKWGRRRGPAAKKQTDRRKWCGQSVM